MRPLRLALLACAAARTDPRQSAAKPTVSARVIPVPHGGALGLGGQF